MKRGSNSVLNTLIKKMNPEFSAQIESELQQTSQTTTTLLKHMNKWLPFETIIVIKQTKQEHYATQFLSNSICVCVVFSLFVCVLHCIKKVSFQLIDSNVSVEF